MEVVKKRRTRGVFSLTQYFLWACPLRFIAQGKKSRQEQADALTPQFASGLVARRAMANYAKLIRMLSGQASC
jgi:hypothetical protein